MNFTEREKEVLDLMAEGRTNSYIEQKMFLSKKTLDFSIGSIYNKLGVTAQKNSGIAARHSRVAAVLIYYRDTNGDIPEDLEQSYLQEGVR